MYNQEALNSGSSLSAQAQRSTYTGARKRIKDFKVKSNKHFSSNQDLGLLSEPHRFNTKSEGR